VEKLSGGEKVRLLLGLMSHSAPHILILDEPTSHLDIDSREALIYALNDFPGAVLLITHDVYLAEATADRLWLVKDGRATTYDGDLEDYRALVMKADRADAKEAKAKQAPTPKADDPDAKKRLTALRKQARDAEERMEKANAAIAKIDAKLSNGNPPADELAKLLKDRAAHADAASAAETKWLEAAEALEGDA
ncbi:MAG: ABC transporter ATP-binding protein, partial [Hyphomonas sp.]|nr:ABC transporter ATP-binding protein [Hyphomonas sp.]